MAAGPGRHLPGDVLRRHAGAATPTSCSGSSRPIDRRRFGAVPLRGRRHEARPPRQGQRGPPDLHATSTMLTRIQGVATRMDARRARRQRARRRAAPRRRLHGLLPRGESALRGRRSATQAAARLPAGDHLSGAGRALRRLPLGAECARRRREDDHLSLVAGIIGRQRRALADARRSTTLADARPAAAAHRPADRGHQRGSARARPRAGADPARGRGSPGRPTYELLLPAPGERDRAGTRARRRCPEPSPGDLFFDIEGDPFALDDGLDYLFGVLETATARSTPIWSRDDDRRRSRSPARRRRSSGCIDFFMERLDRDPTLHVYHYAPYEPTALKRLMGRHGTREDEVDRLLRGERARRPAPGRSGRALRASVESYSIKKLEPLYGFDARDRPARRRLEHRRVRAVARARRGRAAERRTTSSGSSATTATTSSATARLRDWLEALRAELAAATGADGPAPERRATPSRTGGAAAAQAPSRARSPSALTGDVPDDPAERTPEQQARWLLAQLLGWHRREDKSIWWEFYRLMDLTDERARRGAEPLGVLEPVEAARAVREGQAGLALPLPAAGVRPGSRATSTIRRSRRATRCEVVRVEDAELVAIDDAARTRST